MNKQSRRALKSLKNDAGEAIANLDREEAAEFFSELADWAYAQHETMLIDDEPEMQNYDEE